MIRIILYTITLFVAAISNAQVSENRTVGDFSKIRVSQGIQLYFTPSSTKSVKVETDDNEKLAYIKTEIEGNTLRVYIDNTNAKNSEEGKKNRKRKWVNNNNGINFKVLKVWVSGPNVDGFKASSSGSLIVEKPVKAATVSIEASSSGSVSGEFSAKDIDVDVSSSGDIDIKIEAERTKIQASSSGDVDVSGTTVEFQAKASSSADIDAKDLRSKNAKVEASSSADVSIFVSEILDAKASSSASVDYFGNPKQVNAEKSSSGSVTKN